MHVCEWCTATWFASFGVPLRSKAWEPAKHNRFDSITISRSSSTHTKTHMQTQPYTSDLRFLVKGTSTCAMIMNPKMKERKKKENTTKNHSNSFSMQKYRMDKIDLPNSTFFFLFCLDTYILFHRFQN